VAIAVTPTLAQVEGLATLLGCPVVRPKQLRSEANGQHFVVAWGRKPSAVKAESFARQHGFPVCCLEDGFLRSVELGKDDPPLSIVVDDLGIYYDATAPSRLETLIAAPHSDEQKSRGRNLVDQWRHGRVSKYNHARNTSETLPVPYVLVADQTFGDASIRHGLADAASFQRMLDAALAENPHCTVLLKVHPEVMAGRKKGHFDLAALGKNPRVQVLGQDVHPVSLIEHAETVYTVTSQMGFEGLLWGKLVRTFGMPFYAGWGLTRDELSAPDRRRAAGLPDLVHAALIDYPRYLDPETGRRCEVERVLEWMALQRRLRARFPTQIHALNFSRWKKPIVRSFLQGSAVSFVRDAQAVPAGATLALWGRKPVSGEVPEGVKTLRLEDGFLRSVGLGADLVRPLSWVMDSRGIYYDATRPSDLEHLLQTTCFDETLLVRARALCERLVAAGLTKYNVGAKGWERPAAERLILVPGQVESDASLAYGAPGLRRNLDLLRAVREANPEAHVLYKPHPDVVAGLRRQGEGEDDASRWCDEVVVDVSMGELLPQVDEVHTLTSLAGFEALLRGKKVVCHGQPFYAGWGRTEDREPVARRTRRLTLDELVAGTLILYPTYVSRTTGRFTTAERALAELLAWRQAGPGSLPWWRKPLRWVLQRVKKGN
jgi:capsular polysaccharide export protein